MNGKNIGSLKCIRCDESRLPMCETPYRKSAVGHHSHICELFQKDLSRDEAVEQVIINMGWAPQAARNCVNMVYTEIESYGSINIS